MIWLVCALVHPLSSALEIAFLSCRLDQKLRNAISRAEERGCTKELINQINKLSVIMQDKRLKEIYIGVIKEMMIAYRVEIA